jgi:hypothetical protein
MKEASLVKFYFAKYFLLVFGLLQWFTGGVILLREGHIPKGQFTAFVFFTTGLLFVSLFLLVANKIKRVAVGKKKVSVIDHDKTHSYEWPDVKSIKFVPYINMYRIKIRGRKGKIYFLPNETTPAIYGMFHSDDIELKADK